MSIESYCAQQKTSSSKTHLSRLIQLLSHFSHSLSLLTLYSARWWCCCRFFILAMLLFFSYQRIGFEPKSCCWIWAIKTLTAINTAQHVNMHRQTHIKNCFRLQRSQHGIVNVLFGIVLEACNVRLRICMMIRSVSFAHSVGSSAVAIRCALSVRFSLALDKSKRTNEFIVIYKLYV